MSRHILFFLIFALSASAPAAEPSRNTTPISLEELRVCRQVLISPSEEYIQAPCHGRDLSGLIGKWRKEIEAAMGRASRCNAKDQLAVDSKSCYSATELVYLFYVLPRNARGGGPELRITLDANERVTSANWAYTQ